MICKEGVPVDSGVGEFKGGMLPVSLLLVGALRWRSAQYKWDGRHEGDSIG